MAELRGKVNYHGETLAASVRGADGETWLKIGFKMWGDVPIAMFPRAGGGALDGEAGGVRASLELRDDASLGLTLTRWLDPHHPGPVVLDMKERKDA